MTVPHTLTLREAESRLRELVAQAQATREPIVVTTEETAEPVAVLVESGRFETMRKREQQLFLMQLRQLVQLLDSMEQQWETPTANQAFITEFQNGTRILWDICPKDKRGLCVTVDMAARRLAPERLMPTQIAALRHCLERLRMPPSDQAVLCDCRQRLIECGLSPTIAGDESLVRLYVDEL